MARSLIIHVSGSGESIVSEELEFRTVDRRTADARVDLSAAFRFDDLYHLERACEIVVTAYSTGKALRVVSDEVVALTAQQWQNEYGFYAQAHFSALKAILDEEEPDYRR